METNAYSDMLWFNCVKTETMTYRKHDLQKKKKKKNAVRWELLKKWKEGEILHSSVLYIIITVCS